MKNFNIANFNLLNLNEPNLPIYRDSDGWSSEQYNKKIEWTAKKIQQLSSEIIGFQELWHERSLKEVFSRAAIIDSYKLLIPEKTLGEKIVCAAAVHKSIDVESVEWIDIFPEELMIKSSGGDTQTPAISLSIKGFSRPVLHACLKIHPAEPAVHLFVCHFKSKGPTELSEDATPIEYAHKLALGSAISTIRRTAEAAALRVILNKLMKSTKAPVIVVGDINDGQNSNTQNILTEQPKYLFGDSYGGSDSALYSAQIMQEFRDTRDVIYTYSHKDMKESLDHILFSQEFYTHSKNRRWLFNCLTVENDHINEVSHTKDGSSDHGIIKASFEYKPR
jgi:endonuclease/exonuclease/phosphatase family metal-dependent hydrolase